MKIDVTLQAERIAPLKNFKSYNQPDESHLQIITK